MIIASLAVIGLIATSVVPALLGFFGEGGDYAEQDPIKLAINNSKEIATQLENAIEEDSDNVKTITELGHVYFQMGRLYLFDLEDGVNGSKYFEKAMETYGDALDLDDDNDIRVDMGTAAYFSNNYDISEDAFQTAIEKDPDHPIAHFQYGILLYFGKGDIDSAIEKWEALLELEDNYDKTKYPFVNEVIFTTAAGLVEDARALNLNFNNDATEDTDEDLEDDGENDTTDDLEDEDSNDTDTGN